MGTKQGSIILQYYFSKYLTNLSVFNIVFETFINNINNNTKLYIGTELAR